jgi:hypothetical protein
LPEFIHIDPITKPIDESRQCDKPIFCDSLERLEYKYEELDDIAGGLRVKFVPRLHQDDLQEPREVVLVLPRFLLSEGLQVRAQRVLQELQDRDQHSVEKIVHFLSCAFTQGVKGCKTGKGKVC